MKVSNNSPLSLTDIGVLKVKIDYKDVEKYEFIDNVLQCTPSLEAYDYQGTYVTDVCLDDVVGSCDGRYFGKSWRTLFPFQNDERFFLKRGKKIQQKLYKNPQYYLCDEEKEHWSFSNINGKLYITEGHHRTVISRVFLTVNGLPTIIKKVIVSYYVTVPSRSLGFKLKRGVKLCLKSFFN